MPGRNTSAFHRINHYLVDKYLENQLRFYPLDRDLSSGKLYPPFGLGVMSTTGIAASNTKHRLYRTYRVYRVHRRLYRVY